MVNRLALPGLVMALVLASGIGGCGDTVAGGGDATGADTLLQDGSGNDGASNDGTTVDGVADSDDPQDIEQDVEQDTVVNTAPTLTILEPKDGATITLGEAVTVTAQLNDAEDAATTLDVTCWVDAESNVVFSGKGTAEAKVTLIAAGIPAGAHTITCKVTDPGGLSGQATLAVYVNTAPGAPEVAITPAKPTTLDALKAEITADAADVDRKASELTYTYAWLRDGKPTTHVGAELAAGIAKKGETWAVQVVAKDPYASGAVGVAQVLILDAAPTAVELAIAPTPVDLMSTVTCTVTKDATDADGDTLTLTTTWLINGKDGGNPTTATVALTDLKRDDGSPVHKGDKLSCSVVVSDGTLSSAPATSAEVEIAGYDVCGSSSNPCDKNASCTGSDTLAVTCDCLGGWSGDGKSCVDVDECKEGSAGCDANANCTNSPGSSSCACKDGYDGDGKSCTDIDECKTGAAVCDLAASCTNTAGSYGCACNDGYAGDGKTCTDIDECKAGTAVCDAAATCSNTVGAYTCACNKGYSGDGKTCADVDECKDGSAGCAATATCSNTVGSFTCACNKGYAGDGKTCADVDECKDGSAVCDLAASCTNTVGSYTCACNKGYAGDGKTCADVDECKDGSAVCDLAATCTNTVGDYTCTCKDGYSGDGKSCTDVDECGLPDASTPVTIPSGLGGWTVVNSSKTVGWHEDKGVLRYDDPVKGGYNGGGTNKGTATSGSYLVPAGGIVELSMDVTMDVESGAGFDKFTLSVVVDGKTTQVATKTALLSKTGKKVALAFGAYAGKQVQLVFAFDTVDNIANDTKGVHIANLHFTSKLCGANEVCSNKPGSFVCACAPGFTLQNGVCVDIDECSAGTAGCDANAVCANTPGSFTCTCKTYYEGNGKSCTDIDECKTNNGGCGPAAAFSCANEIGAAPKCADIDECKAGSATCDKLATCANTVGSYTCTCPNGYMGDGKTCTDVDECKSGAAYNFSDGLAGWTAVNSDKVVGWQALDGKLYYGDAKLKNFAGSGSNKGTLTSPMVKLSGTPGALSFSLVLDVENEVAFDKFVVSVISGGVTTTLIDKSKLKVGTTAQAVALDLAAYAGKDVQFQFSFDTVDSIGNNTSGVTISDVKHVGSGSVCGAGTTCTNLPGSYSCGCPSGTANVGGVCVGLGIPGKPAPTCAAILAAYPKAVSEVYLIDVDGQGPIPAFDGRCDMVSHGGGWLLVGQQVPGQLFSDTAEDFQPANAKTLDKTFRLGNAKLQAGKPSAAWRITSNDTASGKLVDDVWFKPACKIDWKKYVGVWGGNQVDDLSCGRGFSDAAFSKPISADSGNFNCSKGIGANNLNSYCSIRMGTCAFDSFSEGQAVPCLTQNFVKETVRLWMK